MKPKRAAGSTFSLFSFQDIITSVTGVLLLVTLLLALELALRPTLSSAAESQRIATDLAVAITDAEDEIERLRAVVAVGEAEIDSPAGYTTFSVAEELRAVEGQVAVLETKNDQLQRRRDRAKKQLQEMDEERDARALDFVRLESLQQRATEVKDELEVLINSNRVFYHTADHGDQQVYLVELFIADVLVAVVGERSPPLRFTGRSADADFRSWASTQSPTRVRFVILVHPGTTNEFKRIHGHLEAKGFSIGFDLLPDDKRAIDLERGAE